jgi:ABC-type branched-subunit amino acid transport system ATPase component
VRAVFISENILSHIEHDFDSVLGRIDTVTIFADGEVELQGARRDAKGNPH